MKRGAILLCAMLFSAQASAIDSEKGAYFTALTSMSTELSAYTFMVDQLLEMKCGKSQPIEVINKGSETHIYILLALKEGNYSKAKAILSDIQCSK